MGKYAGFQSVKLTAPQKSVFDLSHQRRDSTRMGILAPAVTLECVPGDVFHGSMEILLRLLPLLAPIYDSIQLFVHFFFVPNRLLWDDWEEFITGGRLGVGIDPVAAPIPPYVDLGEIGDLLSGNLLKKRSLLDWLGCPDFLAIDPTIDNWNGKTIDIMPALAYQLIYMEYYRDRNFVADNFMNFPRPSGKMVAGTAQEFLLLKSRSYLHDYFTSALPFTQRGQEVLMPLAGTGSVSYLEESRVREANGDIPPAGTLGSNVGGSLLTDAGGTPTPGRIENIEDVLIDASSVSINDFRSAYALQVWLERNAVGGSRYTESTQSHFGVRPQDSRLQRPEYIGGGRIPVKISEVVSSSYSVNADDDVIPQANMAGHGITYGNTNRFNYFCAEHGFIMGIVSIMNPPSYHQGLPRMFYARRSFLGYPWPTFAKLGEQQVDDCEIYCTPASMTEDGDGNLPLFGYQSRYADWKYMCNTNRGDFHDILLFWTLTRDFADGPTLSKEFLEFDYLTQARLFAVQGAADNFLMYVSNNITVKRCLPYFGTPNTLGFGS